MGQELMLERTSGLELTLEQTPGLETMLEPTLEQTLTHNEILGVQLRHDMTLDKHGKSWPNGRESDS